MRGDPAFIRSTIEAVSLRRGGFVVSAGLPPFWSYREAMRYGYHCEECEEAIWPATTAAELRWLVQREHVVREVAGHVQAGLDTWIVEALDFLSHHSGHSVVLSKRP